MPIGRPRCHEPQRDINRDQPPGDEVHRRGGTFMPELSLGWLRDALIARPVERAPARHVKAAVPATACRSTASQAMLDILTCVTEGFGFGEAVEGQGSDLEPALPFIPRGAIAVVHGDALVTLDVARGPRGRQGPQVVRGPHTGDADLAVESLDVLARTNAQTLLPGHGEPWTHGVTSAVEAARAS